MSDAIQQDVSPRDKAMQELIESRKGIPTAPREPEQEETQIEPEVPEVEEESQIEEEPQAPSIPMIELEDDEGNIIKVPATAKYRSKVDGQDHLEPLDKITRSYQKGAAADRRLEEATRRQREIEAREAAIAQREAEIAQQKPDLPKGDPKETARKIMSAINDLDDDEAVNALADALSGMSGPDANALITAAREAGRTEAITLVKEREQKLAFERAEKERQTANEWFATEYKDVVSDPMLLKLAMARGKEALEEDPRQDRMKLVKRLGDELREWKAKLSPGTQRNRPAQTPPSIAAKTPKPAEKKPLTREDVLAEMKRMRGQPV
jgi:hypothetical protein